MSALLHHAIYAAARRAPHSPALMHHDETVTYAQLAQSVTACAEVLSAIGVGHGERVAIYLEKRTENVVAMFGSVAAGAVFVPLNPLLRAAQVAYILQHCGVVTLVTSTARLASLDGVLDACSSLKSVLLVDAQLDCGMQSANPARALYSMPHELAAATSAANCVVAHSAPGGYIDDADAADLAPPDRAIDLDLAAILYTSGSTGKPKGVMLSHRNLCAGAQSVCSYLHNHSDDRILAVLPFSFDYGLSQLTTAFNVGASVVLMNYLAPAEIVAEVAARGITGLAAVPPLWQQLARLEWADASALRYVTNSGGSLARPTVQALRARLPQADVFLMYGLTEAFRSTYLDPAQIDRRPGSIGMAVPNAQVAVVRPDGTLCAPEEPGELVHRGAFVALGYWNDAAASAERFRPAPAALPAAAPHERVVWSGDTVRRDHDGYLYFVARRDDMMKVAGYRISPTEVEDVLLSAPHVAEAVVFSVPGPEDGEVIIALVAVAGAVANDHADAILRYCHQRLPAYMVPARLLLQSTPLPRNPNGKFDRARLQQDLITSMASQ